MPNYYPKYQIFFDNELNQEIEIQIDGIEYVGPLFQVTASLDALVLRSTNSDDDKLSPIKGTECVVSMMLREGGPKIQLEDFVTEDDNGIRVTVFINNNKTRAIFQGYVVVEDNSQPYLPDQGNIITFRATDGLGMLKGVDFADRNGQIYVGAHTPVWWLAQLLMHTGQVVNFRTYFNFVNTVYTNVDCLDSFTIDATTFYTGQATSASTDPTVDALASQADDCATALEKLLRNLRCILFWENNMWHIVNLYEYADPLGMAFEEWQILPPVEGIHPYKLVARGFEKNYSVTVGPQEEDVLHAINEDAVRYLKLSSRYVKLNYEYDQSLNKICNQDLTKITDSPLSTDTVSSDVIDKTIKPVVALTVENYDSFCWGVYKRNLGSRNYFPLIESDSLAYITLIRDSLSYEMVRFLNLPPNGELAQTPFFLSSSFLADVGDIVRINFSWRLRKNVSGGFPRAALGGLFLTGIDGTYWSLVSVNDNTDEQQPGFYSTAWVQTGANFQRPNVDFSFTPSDGFFSGYLTGPAAADLSEWQTFTANQTLPVKLPVSGDLILVLPFISNDGEQTWYKDVSVTILPYLQGSYRVLKGDFNLALRNNNIKQVYVDDIQISDSPKRYFKGALLQGDGKTLMPTSWIRKKYPDDTPVRFTASMAKIVYNNVYRQLQKIEGTFRGLTYKSTDYQEGFAILMTGFLNGYYFRSHPTPTKKFLLTSFENDIATGSGRRVFVELLNDADDDGWKEPDSKQFQYIFDNNG